MAKSHSADGPKRSNTVKPQHRPKSIHKRTTATKRRASTTSTAGSRGQPKAAGAVTKQQVCLEMLKRSEGATVEALQAATGWQQHSVRGFLSGAVKKKLGLALLSEKPDGGPRRYRIPKTV